MHRISAEQGSDKKHRSQANQPALALWPRGTLVLVLFAVFRHVGRHAETIKIRKHTRSPIPGQPTWLGALFQSAVRARLGSLLESPLSKRVGCLSLEPGGLTVELGMLKPKPKIFP